MSFEVDGRRLRELRVERALTQRALLGEESGIAYDTINKLELGRRPTRCSREPPAASAARTAPLNYNMQHGERP